MDSKFYQQLKEIDNTSWKTLLGDAKNHKEWNERKEWWNIKFYRCKRNKDNKDDSKIQEDFKGNKEIPNKRNIFKIYENARFGLKDKPIAYLSNEWSVATCESFKKFRNNRLLSLKDLDNYIKGDIDPDVCDVDLSIEPSYGYPTNFIISRDSLMLDLREPCNQFLKMLQNRNIISDKNRFYQDTIIGRDKSRILDIYSKTQSIAEIAFNNGFHGILYKSAREPNDVILNGNNVVLFNEEKCRKWTIEEARSNT